MQSCIARTPQARLFWVNKYYFIFFSFSRAVLWSRDKKSLSCSSLDYFIIFLMCFGLLFVCLIVVPRQALFRRWVGVMLIALFLRICLSFFFYYFTTIKFHTKSWKRKIRENISTQYHLATRDIDIVRRVENQSYCHTYFEYK